MMIEEIQALIHDDETRTLVLIFRQILRSETTTKDIGALSLKSDERSRLNIFAATQLVGKKKLFFTIRYIFIHFVFRKS